VYSRTEPPTFYYDVGSPYAWLVAERLASVLRGPVRWQPVLLGGLFKLTGRSSWALGDRDRRAAGMAEVERRARRYGLPAVRWPEPWPGNTLTAMRAAVLAHRAGRGEAYARAAFRLAFLEGRDLTDPGAVLAAATAAGLDPVETRAGLELADVKAELREATQAAHARGVFGVPTVAVGGALLWGDDRLEEAARVAPVA